MFVLAIPVFAFFDGVQAMLSTMAVMAKDNCTNFEYFIE